MDVDPRLDGTDRFALFDLATLSRDGMDAWLVETLQRCAQWFRASGASAFLLEEGDLYRIRARTGRQAKMPGDAYVKVGEGIAGTVLSAGVPLIVGDPTKNPVLNAKGVGSKKDIASAMVVPLIGTEDERIGVLNFSRSANEPPFLDNDLSEAVSLGRHVAMAVTNARLVDLLQKALADQDRKTDQLVAVLGTMAGTVHVFDGRGQFEDGQAPKPRLRGRIEESIQTVLSTRQQVEAKVYDQESDETWLLTVAPLRTGGGVVTVQDMTRYQRAEEETSRLRRLAEIGQMTAAVAHELRNPLTGIRGAAQLISAEPSLAEEYAKVIEEEAIKMNGLCSDFLELSKPLKLKLEQRKLGEVASRVVGLYEPEFVDADVDLEIEVVQPDPDVSIDAKRVEQILHNLLRNALQASRPGTRVLVQVANGLMTVADQGTGMDEEAKARLFSPFFTTKPSGTGLGLCNVRRIIDAHGATVDVWSEPGQGTRFEVCFKRNVA